MMFGLSFTSFKKDSEDGVDVDSCLRTSSYVKSLCPRIGRSIENKQTDSKVSSNTFYDLSRIVTHCPSDTDSCLRAPDRFKRFACDLFSATFYEAEAGIDLHFRLQMVEMKAATASIIPISETCSFLKVFEAGFDIANHHHSILIRH